MAVSVKINDFTDKVGSDVEKNVKESFKDVVLDLKRVSSAAAPHDTGKLEKNKYRIKASSKGLTGEVYFKAKRKNFDYAEFTHNAEYNLGEKSKRKSGGKSKFASGSIDVGKGYLTNTLESSQDGYIEHIADSYGKALR